MRQAPVVVGYRKALVGEPGGVLAAGADVGQEEEEEGGAVEVEVAVSEHSAS